MKKRWVYILLTVSLIGSALTGCGNENDTSANGSGVHTEESMINTESEAIDESESNEDSGYSETEITDATDTSEVPEAEDASTETESGTTNNTTADNNTSNNSTNNNTNNNVNNKPNNNTTSGSKSEVVQNVIKKIIKNDMSDLEKAKAIHDYLVINVDYDAENYFKGTIPKTSATVEGTLTTKYAVCEGYARTFQALCNAAGIECEYVTGTGNGGSHAWNQVQIGGKWYNVDVTWDDPIKLEGEDFNDHSHNRYNYFLISDEIMYKDHSTKTAKHVCTDSLYFEVLEMGIPWCDYVYVNTKEEFTKAVVKNVEKNATEMRFFIKAGILDEDTVSERWEMDKYVKEAILTCNVYDDYEIYYSGVYETDAFGVFRYVAKIKLKNGVYTKFKLFSTIDDVKEEILRLGKNLTEEKTYDLYVTKELAETNFIDDSIRRWAFYEHDISVSHTGGKGYSDKVQIVSVYLQRVTENHYYTEYASSYEEVEAYIIEMLERGDKDRYIRLNYTNIPLENKFSAYYEIEESFVKEMEEKYGLAGCADPNNVGENEVMLYFRKL